MKETTGYHSVNTPIYIAHNINNLRMSSNALSVSALKQACFQLFAESVKTVAVHRSVSRAFHVVVPHTLWLRLPGKWLLVKVVCV